MSTTSDAAASAIEKIKELMAKRRELVQIYDARKKAASEAHQELEDCEHKILEFLTAAKLDKFSAPELGTTYIINRFTVRVPKTIEEKRALFDYIQKQHGDDALMAMLSINSNSLNAFHKEELERKKEDPLWSLPGVEEPTHQQTLGFRKV